MNKFESASILAGVSQKEGTQAYAPTNLHVITGEVAGKSENGKTLVQMDGMVFTGDDDQTIEMDTLGGLEEGDIATILLTGESGQGMSPLAIGSAGSIDRIRNTAESAETLAQQAETVASATGQHFWDDDNGAHVTEITREEWEEAPSGSDVVINSQGQLFRVDENNLLALLPGDEVTDTFTIVDDPDDPFPTYTLSARPVMFPTIKVGGEVKSPSLFYLINENTLTFDGDTSYWLWDGQTMEVTYRTSPAMVIYDGDGNADSNIIASFESGKVSLAKKRNPDSTETGEIEFFNGAAELTVQDRGGYPDVTLGIVHEAGGGDIRISPGNARMSAGSGDDHSGSDYYYGEASVELTSGEDVDQIEISAATLSLRPGYGLIGGEWSMQDIITMLESLFDTWHVGTFASPFSNYDGLAQNAPRWRKFGNVVEFHGVATVASQQTAGNRKLFTLPSGYRPTGITRYAGIMQGSNMNRFLLRVNTSGEVYMERYGTTSDSAIPANAWLTLTGMFII